MYRQSSVERDEDMHSMTHTVAQGHEEMVHSRPKAKTLKSVESSDREGDGGNDDEEEDDEHEADAEAERINRLEQFKKLPGDLIEVTITKDQRYGFGIALSGHKDRNRMGTYICGVNPIGPGSKTSLLIGDELLKVRVCVRA